MSKKMKGIKATCSMTRDLGRYMGDNVQVFYDIEKNEVFGIYHTLNEWTEMHDENIIYVTTYYRAATQKDIIEAVEIAKEEM